MHMDRQIAAIDGKAKAAFHAPVLVRVRKKGKPLSTKFA
jgi:hypothetical protein